METQNNCPNCGQPLETNALQGLCPECLIKAGWPTLDRDESETDHAGFVPPDIEDLARLFPQLEILELIGRGGMGAVYKARQPNLDRLVALKILAQKAGSDPGFSERFTREARALAKLSHPSIVGVYDFGHTGDLSYFIMEHVDGPNLREIERAGQLTPKEALEIIPQICEALQFAHDAGVVHRDIKPENILLDQNGHVKIADFGLAKIMGQERTNFTLTEPNHVMGTPHYMAPEQVEHPKDVDHRADIYSLGVVFYEMLTGELPLGKFAPPSCKVQMDVRLDEVVLRTLAKEPELRYQQASQVRTEVQTIVSTPQAKASSDSPKTSLCYISTPDYLRTFRGRFFNIYQGKGELSLSNELLSFQSGWQAVTIPLSSISTLAQGEYPRSAKPLPLHFVGITFEEHGISRTLLFTPVRTEVMSPWEANKINAQWLSDLQEAVRVRTGRTLSVGHLDVAQDTSWWEYVKLYLFFAATSIPGFSLIPIMLEHRLPNRLIEFLPGPIFAIPMFFMCLTMPRWLGWFRNRANRRQSRTENESKPDVKISTFRHKQESRKISLECLKATGLHGIVAVFALALISLYIPKFVTLFAYATSPVPGKARFVIDLTRFLQAYALIELPLLLLIDFGIGSSLRRFFGRRAFRYYSFACLSVLILAPVIMFKILLQTTPHDTPIVQAPQREALQTLPSELAFRIVPKNAENQGPLSAEEEAQLRQALRDQGPFSDGNGTDYIWVPFQGEVIPAISVTETYQGQVYILASNRPGEVMLPDGSWGLEETGLTTNREEQSIVSIRFDGPGADMFYDLTGYTGQSLGIIVDDAMVAMPTIQSRIRNKGNINGRFTQQQARQLADALRAGMPSVSLASAAGVTPSATPPMQAKPKPPINTSNMPPEAQKVYQVLKDWYGAGTIDGAEERVQYLTPDQSAESSLRWIDRLNQIIPNRSDKEPVPRAIHWDDREALFISDKLELPKEQSDEPMVLLCLLT
ncbi:MAG: protein kinase, partial [Phycisphaeraceae bacterium]|nr:protein kinase [Phycisphaeraceae bacterium]